MKAPVKTVFWWLTAASGVLLILLTGVFWESVAGFCSYRFGRWDEDAYKGKTVGSLQATLSDQNGYLRPASGDEFIAYTGRFLRAGQRVMIFHKGKEYSWFRIGTAQNVGYVVIEQTEQGEQVLEIVREIHVDSL